MIDPNNKNLSVVKQCRLLELPESSYYYKTCARNKFNETVMKKIDEIYTAHPFYGTRKITHILRKAGYSVNRKRVQRLMRIMGIQAIYQKPRLSIANIEHKKYPYLLREIDIIHSNQVWCADITYIRLNGGWCYLVAIMDWYSRYIISWKISNTLDSAFCIEALEDALSKGRPEIFNTDQGVQFTSNDFTDVLKKHEIKISMDGKGRFMDNIFIERFWRNLKYEKIYLNDYSSIKAAKRDVCEYVDFYNRQRLHQSLEYETPFERYIA